MKKIVVIVASIIFLTACAGNQNVAHPYDREDSNGTRLMTNREGNGIYNRELDDDRTNTNQSPNFIDLSGSRPNFGTEEGKLEEALRDEKGLEMGQIIRNGQNINVTVHSTNSISKDSKKQKEKELVQKMNTALPGYHIKVKLEEK